MSTEVVEHHDVARVKGRSKCLPDERRKASAEVPPSYAIMARRASRAGAGRAWRAERLRLASGIAGLMAQDADLHSAVRGAKRVVERYLDREWARY